VKILERFVDERFLTHRLRSTSTAGILVSVGSIVLFEYRYFVQHVANWDLLAVAVTFAVVKVALMVWYATHD
jgi:hypothetical protein